MIELYRKLLINNYELIIVKLSVAYAIHNEEQNIIRSLESVYEMADEIVIVDGKSTDDTVDIIKKYDRDKKVNIYEYDNPSMFHINKQRAIEKCKGDWILQMDADELVSEDLKSEILNLLNSKFEIQNSKLTQSPIAYWIPRLNYFLGKPLRKGGQYPDSTIRFYKNGVAKFPCKTVHEQVEVRSTEILSTAEGSPDQQNNNEIIGTLKSDLLHFPYPSFSSYIEKWDRYNTQEAELLRNSNIQPSTFNLLKYFVVLPKLWFLKTYFRHKGFQDGFAGFVFSLFSAIRYWGIYI
ncbi:MAG TPA: glycosyltransferase family 2 protein, partial [Candidatus Nitrosocosmicus sp.]|nr:glycosyltransferase family 2 protein [Candidatus Nitrosocosmicus sp.]